MKNWNRDADRRREGLSVCAPVFCVEKIAGEDAFAEDSAELTFVEG